MNFFCVLKTLHPSAWSAHYCSLVDSFGFSNIKEVRQFDVHNLPTTFMLRMFNKSSELPKYSHSIAQSVPCLQNTNHSPLFQRSTKFSKVENSIIIVHMTEFYPQLLFRRYNCLIFSGLPNYSLQTPFAKSELIPRT